MASSCRHTVSPAVGKEAVHKAYDAVFEELKFHVKFTIAELVVMAPTWAYVRTNSAGTTDHHSTGRTTAEANQELFIFKKGDDGSTLQLLADQSAREVIQSETAAERRVHRVRRTVLHDRQRLLVDRLIFV
jgi:ketosteroid isomerase-like protein